MEKEINIAEILKNVPIGTKLYSPLFGDVFLKYIGKIFITVKHHGKTANFYHNSRLYDYEGTEPMLFPSREMRDWSKFIWKKGDILISNDGSTEVIFDGWYDDTYTSFYGKHYLDSENENNIKYFEGFVCTTEKYFLEDKDVAQTYINTIEERLDGKLNRKTLEIEKTQPEFKDGDILYCEGDSLHLPMTLILKTLPDKMQKYAYMNNETYDWLHICCDKTLDAGDISRLRYATEEEKQHLFNALAKEGKAWDAEKKQIVYLKPKIEFKPFDKVLVRNYDCNAWQISLFGYKNSLNCYHCCNGVSWIQCIPYEGNEHLLGTKNKVEN